MVRLLDISPPIDESLAVWPGDVPYRRDVSLDMARGDHLTLSAIHTTVHLGAHTDAPNHYHRSGGGIGARPLQKYYGPCQVVQVSLPRGRAVEASDITEPIAAPRVLVRTDSYPDPRTYNPDFNSLSPSFVELVGRAEGQLVGIDTPSIDLFASKGLPTHQAVADHDMAVLEGVVLQHVPPGLYTLIALPLPLKDADASPVRAVLVAEH